MWGQNSSGDFMTYKPFEILGENRDSRFLVTCDHATNCVPPDLGGTLGLPRSDMERHIAYDVGAAGVAKALGAALGAPVIQTRFSRLVIDPNRGEDDPTLLMKLYDGTVIPGNRHAGPDEKRRRLEAYYRPYHDALERMTARRDDTVILSVHSFTPQLRARPPRPWHIGILHAQDRRLSDALLAVLETMAPDVVAGRNVPYDGHLPGDAIERHALRHGRHNTLIEIRNDLVTTQEQQHDWGQRLAIWVQAALDRVDDRG